MLKQCCEEREKTFFHKVNLFIIIAGGENIAPIPIEETIKKQLPCVANAMLIGDRKKFLSVLLTLKTEVDPVTLEPLPELAPITLEWCSSIGSKAKVRFFDLAKSFCEILTATYSWGIKGFNKSHFYGVKLP